ncbi:hypothetical protein HanIR_Chr08g0376261 [Helianthus annuus]|nr:hypothetical protein HanIR_Chr08g0376261 [Helianthus annuus]
MKIISEEYPLCHKTKSGFNFVAHLINSLVRVLLSTPPYLLFSPPSSHILTGGACVAPTVFLSQGGCNQEGVGGVYRMCL